MPKKIEKNLPTTLKRVGAPLIVEESQWNEARISSFHPPNQMKLQCWCRDSHFDCPNCFRLGISSLKNCLCTVLVGHKKRVQVPYLHLPTFESVRGFRWELPPPLSARRFHLSKFGSLVFVDEENRSKWRGAKISNIYAYIYIHHTSTYLNQVWMICYFSSPVVSFIFQPKDDLNLNIYPIAESFKQRRNVFWKFGICWLHRSHASHDEFNYVVANLGPP